MRVVLLRHGIACDLNELRAQPGKSRATDADRPLTARGIRRVKKAARGLSLLGVRPQCIAHSGLVRAKETAELVARRLRFKRALAVTDALVPEADPQELFAWLAAARVRSALCVGHLPHLDRFVALACGAPGRFVTNLGKAAAIAFEIPDSGRPAGRLLWFLPAKLLRRMGETTS